MIDATLTTAEAFDVAVCLHTDGLNESGELEETVAAIARPDDPRVSRRGRRRRAHPRPDRHRPRTERHLLLDDARASPTRARPRPSTLDMILIVHEGNPPLAEDVAAARERIHPGDHGRRGAAA